ncbi:MAG: DUF120 domain-containing protein [Candidatus Kariarchaeaceae archaeon]
MKKIEGYIVSGTGRGSKFITMPVYSRIFSRLLNATPYPGTLNIKLDQEYVNLVNQYFRIGTKYDNLVTNGKTTGGIILNHFFYDNDNENSICIGVRPLLTSHETNVLEIVSQHYLRQKLNLKDDSRLTLYITDKM